MNVLLYMYVCVWMCRYNRVLADEGNRDKLFSAEVELDGARAVYAEHNQWFWRWRGGKVRY